MQPDRLSQIQQQRLDHIRTAIGTIRVSIQSAETIRSLGSDERAEIVEGKARDLWQRLAQDLMRESEGADVIELIRELRDAGLHLGIDVDRYLPLPWRATHG